MTVHDDHTPSTAPSHAARRALPHFVARGGRLTRLAAALAMAVGCAGTGPALAQWNRSDNGGGNVITERSQGLNIVSMDVEQVNGLQPGTELAFTLWGTPGAQARLQIDGAPRSILLEETSAGVYRGWYTVRGSDRLRPDSRVTANLRSGSRVVSSVLGEPLVAGYAAQVPAVNSAPAIENFSAQPEVDSRGNRSLIFSLRGTPGGQASMRLRGTQDNARIALSETNTPGLYQGRVALQPGTRIDLREPATARLRVGDRTVTAQLNPALDGRMVPVAMQVQGGWCNECGSVTAIRPVEVRGEGGYVGTVAGGLIGGVLGNQVGGGDGRKLATVGGAVAGALLGRELERRRGESSTHHEVVVRMDNGEERIVSVPDAGPLRVGTWVRINAENQIAIDEARMRQAPRN